MVKFTLQDIEGVVVFGTEKVSNWADLEPKLVRSDSLYGQTTEITNSFTFVDNIRTRIMQRYEEYGNNAFVSLKIEIGYDNNKPSSYTNISYGAPLVAQFKDFTVTELDVSISFAESDFQQKIMTNEKENLNITLDTNLQGGAATDYNTLLRDTFCHDRTLQLNTSLGLNTDVEQVTLENNETYISVPYSINYKSDDDIKNNIYIQETNITATSLYYYLDSESDKPYNLKYNVDFNLAFIYEPVLTNSRTVELVEIIKNDNNQIVGEVVLATNTWEEGDFIKRFTSSLDRTTINLFEGYSIGLILRFGEVIGISTIVDYQDLTTSGEMISLQGNSLFDSTICKSILPHEFFTHWIELMTGKKNAFYSDFFGRTDIGYSQDGEGAYCAILGGYMLRNMPTEEYPANTNFRDVLDDMIKIFGLAAQIEYLGDTEVFRIEKRNRLFLNEIVLDLGELYNGVSLSNSADRTFTKIVCGYDDIELENLNGLQIFNGEVNYSLNINTDENILDLKVKGIAADYAIEQTRRLQFDIAPNEDGKNDKKIFYILCTKSTADNVTALKGSFYNNVSGILSPDNAYNIGLSPARILRNNGDLIKACLVQDQEIILTKSASNNTLSADGINEGDNIDSSILPNALYTNQDISIESAPIELDQWLNLSEKRNGIITFVSKGIDLFMYHDMASYKYSEETINIEGRRANR